MTRQGKVIMLIIRLILLSVQEQGQRQGQGQGRAGRGTCGTLLVYAMLFKIHTGIFFHFITFSLIEKINTS